MEIEQPTEHSIARATGWKRALQITLPVAMGYAPAGMAFGVLASAAGIPWWISVMISIVVFSGAAQYAAIPLVAGGAGIFNLTLNTFVINLRHIFYALPLVDILPHNRWKRAYCLFCLTDECFSVMSGLSKVEQKRYFLQVAFLVHTYWVVATIAGIIAGEQLANLIPHLEFALPALFVILWYEQMRVKNIWWPTLIAVICYLLSLWLFPQYVLIIALLLSVGLIMLRSAIFRHLSKEQSNG